MKTADELKMQWNKCHGIGQVLVDHTHPLSLYLNINSSGNKELLIPVKQKAKFFKSTVSLGVNYYTNLNNTFLGIELLNEELENEYISLCLDLIESSRNCVDSELSRKKIIETFKKWYFLLADKKNEILSEIEIRGLIGEVRFMLDELDSGKPDDAIVTAWKVYKDSSRDFIYDDVWYEIKTIQSTKDYVTISSLDQLGHDSNGFLTVYVLDKSNQNTLDSITLNSLIGELKSKFSFRSGVALDKKLLLKGYQHNKKYDEIPFVVKGKTVYLVNQSFPCLTRSNVSDAICNAEYDIRLSKIDKWKV